MGSKGKKREFEFEAAVERDRAIGYLEKVLAGLRAGTVCLQRNGRGVTLKPADVLAVEVEGKAKEEKEALSIKLKWRTIQKQEVSSGEELEILSTEPEPPAEPEEAPEEESFPAE